MWRLTDEQRELRDSIRSFAQEVVRPKMLDVDSSSPYPMDVHEALAEEGLLKLAIPAAYGGRDSTNVAYCSFIEELARVSGTASLMGAYVKLTSLPIILAGSEEQKQRFLPGLASGEHLGSYAITEPGVGSDPAALRMSAERRGDTWVLNGTKRFIGNAGLSQLYVVFARTGEDGAGGVSAFVVDGQSDGLSVEELPTMGMPGWRLGAPTFTDVEVPHANLLGEEGDGFKIAMGAFDTSRPTVASQAVGLGQGAIDLALDYARRRETFGEPLIEHQGVQFKLAGLEAKVAAARSLTYQAATCVDEQDPRTTKLAAAAKLFASDTAMEATTEAVQVLGGNGYLKEFPAERMMRDAKVLQIYEGANEIQMLVIARQMVEEAEARGVIWTEAVEAEGRTEPAGADQVGARA
ncbi:MAG: acyl-CoA dehydrogenase family protein [Solirubrobacterales bacterium]|nr:acyl-CoA dehydrogenase family protein [Solirubrobacterales bacterium]